MDEVGIQIAKTEAALALETLNMSVEQRERLEAIKTMSDREVKQCAEEMDKWLTGLKIEAERRTNEQNRKHVGGSLR